MLAVQTCQREAVKRERKKPLFMASWRREKQSVRALPRRRWLRGARSACAAPRWGTHLIHDRTFGREAAFTRFLLQCIVVTSVLLLASVNILLCLIYQLTFIMAWHVYSVGDVCVCMYIQGSVLSAVTGTLWGSWSLSPTDEVDCYFSLLF